MKILCLSSEKNHFERSEIDKMIDEGQAVESNVFGCSSAFEHIWYLYKGDTYCLCSGKKRITIGSDPEMIGGYATV